MIDAATKQVLRVQDIGQAGPFLDLPADQLPEATELLTDHGIEFEVEENEISLDDGPFYATINFGRGADSRRIQAALDARN